MSMSEIKLRIAQLTALVDEHGYDRVSEVSGLKISTLTNYVKPTATKTIGKNTLRLLELELRNYDKSNGEIR